jgi:hypothetical protein
MKRALPRSKAAGAAKRQDLRRLYQEIDPDRTVTIPVIIILSTLQSLSNSWASWIVHPCPDLRSFPGSRQTRCGLLAQAA